MRDEPGPWDRQARPQAATSSPLLTPPHPSNGNTTRPDGAGRGGTVTRADPGYARWSCGPLPAWLSLHPHCRLSPRTARSSHNEQPGRALCPPPGKLPASFRGGCHLRLWDASPDPSSWAVPLPGLGFHQTEGWRTGPTPSAPAPNAAHISTGQRQRPRRRRLLWDARHGCGCGAVCA